MGLKVLLIGAYPLEPGTVYGGIESATSTLVPALARRDDVDSVTVLRFHNGDAQTLSRRESPKVDVRYVRGQNRFAAVTGSFLDVRRARRLIAEVKPDIVHGQEIGRNGDIAVRSFTDTVVTVHGMVHVEIRMAAERSIRARLRIRLFDNMVRRVLSQAKAVVSVSEYDAEQLADLIRGRAQRIPNPTAEEFFALAPSGPTAPRLLYAGMLTPLKNPLGLVNAFARVRAAIPQARLALVGAQPDPKYTQAIRDRVTSLGISDSVEIVGLVDVERLRREIQASRAVVMFSRQENAPTIIAQAMAAGKPVVATRVGGVSQMIDDGETGFLVESEDEVALAARLETVLKDQDRCLQMGNRAHDVARERYLPEAVAEMTVQAYRNVLERRAPSPTASL